MVSLDKVFLNFLKDKNINIDNEKVCIACSSGVDSSVLLYLLQYFSASNIIVCHVNHGKRKESIKEEEYLNDYCLKFNLKFYCYHIKYGEIKSNFQEEARNIRYNFFKDVMRKENCKYLFLAHHLNDDIETMLFRLNRGSSLIGYSGISDIVKIDEGLIVRPLLTVLKSDIYSFAKEYNITYFEDSSNSTDHYDRNALRHHAVPTIFKEIENASSKFLEMKENIKGAALIINDYRDAIIDDLFKSINNGVSVSCTKFLRLNEFIQTEVLFEVCKKYRLSKKAILEIIDIIKSKRSNIDTNIGGVFVVKSYDNLYLLDKFDKTNSISYELNNLNEGIYKITDFLKIEISKISDVDKEYILKDRNILCINESFLPLTIRCAKSSDIIKLEYGKKSCKRLFIDKKIDIIQRINSVVCLSNNEVLIIPGIEKSKVSLRECALLTNCTYKINFIY